MSLRIKELLKEKKMTIQQVADIIGISRVALGAQLHGNPTLSTLERIAKALEVPVTDLFQPETKKAETTITICPYCGNPIAVHVKVLTVESD